MIFANVTDWTIPEGAVNKVTDSLGRVIWQRDHHDYSQDYFFVENLSNETATLTIKGTNTSPIITVYKSSDQTNWTSMGSTSETDITATVPANSKLYLRANCNTWSIYNNDHSSTSNIKLDKRFGIGGNIMSLLRGSNFRNTTFSSSNKYAFFQIFRNNYTLVDVHNLILPNNTVRGCYEWLFNDCTSLANTPVLPATTMTEGCYDGMFMGCTSLVTPPTLPAETLAEDCYDGMFKNCTSLTIAPALPATTMAFACYNSMFMGCQSLTTAPALPATTLAENCYALMFSGCTSLTTTPVLPALMLVDGCYQNMFYNCSSLNTVTIHADDISAGNCLTNWMSGVAATGDFYNMGDAEYTIDSPNGIPQGWTEHSHDYARDYLFIKNTSANDKTISIKGGSTLPNIDVYKSTDQTNWELVGTTSSTSLTITIPAYNRVYLKANTDRWGLPTAQKSGTIITGDQFAVGGNIMSLLRGDNFYNAVFNSNNTGAFNYLFSVYATDAKHLILPSNTVDYCYANMFYYGYLTDAPALPATTLAPYCYYEMFNGCKLTTAPALPATTLADSCCFRMFRGCTHLTTAPALPATTLADSCYEYMFRECSSLTTAPALPATTLTVRCYEGMFYDCTSLTTAPALPATTLAQSCYYDMFNGCTYLNQVTTYADDISATSCIYNWLNHVAATGDFYNLGSATYPSGASGIPTGWTEHNTL